VDGHVGRAELGAVIVAVGAEFFGNPARGVQVRVAQAAVVVAGGGDGVGVGEQVPDDDQDGL